MNGLVLEGGGARGSYHVGAIKALRKKHIKIDYVVGTSIGSINGAFVASKDYKKLEALWKSASSKELFGVDQELINAIKNKKITKNVIKDGIQTIYQIIKNSGIDVGILKNMLIKNIDEDKLRKSNIDFGLVTYNMSKRKQVQVFKDDIPKGKLIEYLIASSYLPIFKMQRIIDESFYVDGGIFDGCPIDMLVDKNLDNIYVVRAHLYKLPKYKTNSNITIIKPYKKLGSIITFGKDITDYNILLGYYDTLKELDKLDGNKYYFKHKNDVYYQEILKNEKIIKLYNKSVLLSNKKKIISILEDMCDYFKIKRFKIHNVAVLVIKLKIINIFRKKNVYSKFIKELKVKF